MRKLRIWLRGVLSLLCGACLLLGSCSDGSVNDGGAKKLASPLLIAEGTELSWNEITGASGYLLSVNEDSLELASSVLTYSLATYKDGLYTVSVIAVGEGKYKNSDSSNSVQVLIKTQAQKTQLEKPVLSELAQGVVAWTAVENASGYLLSINGAESVLSADILQFDLSDFSEKELAITVTAMGEGAYKDSEPSETLTVIRKNQLTVQSKTISVKPSQSFALNEQTLGLTTEGEATFSYQVTYNDFEEVTLTGNEFTTAEAGYYGVSITATYDEEEGLKAFVLLVVEGSFVYGFDEASELTGTWVANTTSGLSDTRESALVSDEYGNKAWQVTVKQGGTGTYFDGKINMNIPVLSYDTEKMQDGDLVRLTFAVRMSCDPATGVDGQGNSVRNDYLTVTSISPQTTVEAYTRLGDGLYRVTLTTPLNSASGTRNYLASGFVIQGARYG